MNLTTRFRQRVTVLAVAALAVTALAATPFLGQAQDAEPAPTEEELLQTGEQIYNSVCIACHQPDGKGIPGIYLPLNGNPLLTGDDPIYFIETVLHGRGGMPRFAGTFDDAEIAGVVSYVRQAWENDAGPVSPDQVADVRAGVHEQPEGATPTPEGQLPSSQAGRGLATPGASPVASPEATPAD
jgi:mono/diheme cytochrome c family protein